MIVCMILVKLIPITSLIVCRPFWCLTVACPCDTLGQRSRECAYSVLLTVVRREIL